MLNKKNRRLDSTVNAGSMADIAFLLLIFFLVTTTILSDKGIMVRLPPIYEGPIPPRADRNVLDVKINSFGELLVEKNPLPIEALRETVKDFIMNPQQRKDMPKSPKKAVISLQNDRSTAYENYLSVYNELQAAYRELRDQAAQKRFKKNFADLAGAEKKEIKNAIPLIISEAEPVDFAAQ